MINFLEFLGKGIKPELEVDLEGYGKVNMEVKYPDSILEYCGQLKPVILWFEGTDEYYTGVLIDVDEESNEIMLTSLSGKHTIGLPFLKLKYYAVKVD